MELKQESMQLGEIMHLVKIEYSHWGYGSHRRHLGLTVWLRPRLKNLC